MWIKLLIFLSILFSDVKIESKAEKYLSKYYKSDTFILKDKPILNGNLYLISNSTDFIYIGTSKSRFEDFEFMVLLDESKTIKLVKILVYRENYGGEICSKRWLRQFIGKSKPLPFVDAISGATISVNSLKYSINNLLKQI